MISSEVRSRRRRRKEEYLTCSMSAFYGDSSTAQQLACFLRGTKIDKQETAVSMMQHGLNATSTCSIPNKVAPKETETEDEKIFMDELNRLIMQYNTENKQHASSTVSPKKRLASVLTTSATYATSQDGTTQQKRHRLNNTENNKAQQKLQLQLKLIKEEPLPLVASHPIRSNLGSKDDIFVASDDATKKPPIALFGEFVECKSQSADVDFKSRQTPFDSSAKDTSKVIDFHSVTLQRKNILDVSVNIKSHQTNHEDSERSLAMAGRARSTTPTIGQPPEMRRRTVRREDNKISYWHKKFEEMRQYKDTHGNCLVRYAHPTLGSWVSTQRQNYKKMKEGNRSHMTQERIDLLTSIGFKWTVHGEKKLQLSWHESFEALRKYKKTYGNCLVNNNHPTLGKWIKDQQLNFKNLQEGKSSHITQDRIDLLNSIEFVWVISKGAIASKVLWRERFEELREYKETHGDCLVRQDYPTLGSWVNRQRQNYKNMKELNRSPMTQERVDLLNSISFVWTVGSGTTHSVSLWHKRFEELRKYKETHGDCLVRQSYPTLGKWVSKQRQKFKNTKKKKSPSITQDQIALLDSIGFSWVNNRLHDQKSS